MKEITVLDTDIDVNFLKKKVIKNEKKIIKKYPPTNWNNTLLYDGETGLGYESLTSRSCHFNVLDWFGTKKLGKKIKQSFLEHSKQNHKNIYVQCWANVMRKGEKIHPHSHSSEQSSLISGNLFLYSDHATSTYYEGIAIENLPGRMTIFPGFVKHWTDTYWGDAERISIAFDILTEYEWKYAVKEGAKSHWKKI